MIDREEWRPCLGGRFEASNDGRVRRVGGRHILCPRVNRGGYWVVHIHTEDVNSDLYVHALVAEAFHGPRPPGQQVNHINGDKLDARAANLEWVTPSANRRHAFTAGLQRQARGERHHLAKLTYAQVQLLRSDRANGASLAECARRYGVSISTVSEIANWRSRRRS